MVAIDTAVEWMQQVHGDAIDRLEHWCNQNSWSYDTPNLQQMADQLCEDFGQFGATLEQVPLSPLRLLGERTSWIEKATGPALVWHHNADAPRRVLLMIHYDTVYPMGSSPERCQRRGNQLVGPGTIDAKGGIAVIAMAVEAVLKFGLAEDTGVSILLNPDEEIGSSASRPLMEELAPQFDVALLFEPTLPDGSLVAARKGTGNFSFIVHGKSAHSGRNPEDGRNSIVHASKLVPRLTSLHDPAGGVLLNIGRIGGGDALNQVPDLAFMQLNIRVAELDKMRSLESELRSIADDFTREEYRVELSGEFHCPPKPVDDKMRELQTQVERAGRAAGRAIQWRDTGGASDGNKLAGYGLANVDTLGLSGSGMHSAEELCDTDSLVPAARTIAAFIASVT